MQIRRTTAAIALTAIVVLAGFNVYQSQVIKVQRQLVIELYYDSVALAHLLQGCMAGK